MKNKNRFNKLITKDRLAQKVVLEILIHRCDDMTIGKAKSIARDISVQVRNIIHEVDSERLQISDDQASSESFWIDQIKNSGKDFNQKP